MNIYSTTFFANCPTNGVRIDYKLRIETNAVIAVESIIDCVSTLTTAFHEALADMLFTKFGGVQELIAHHHGVRIETIRK